MMYSVRDVQSRLAALGYNPGPTDGIRGRRTIGAVKEFQRDSGLKVDGLVGPKTGAALFGDDQYARQQIAGKPSSAFADATPWMDEARKMLGAHEARDKASLWRWLKSDGGSVGDPSKIPWCGDFVRTALGLTLPDEAFPNNPYWARNWAKFGVPCPPVFGAIAVFTRGKGGHVAFVVKRDPARKRLLILGGNQSNSVTETWKSESTLIATRWPKTALPHSGRVDTASSKGARLSTNEA